ncbi:MAG: flagellar motor switch protein FliN [Gammaproteobacteria bacterium]|nr:MAG: flagellar motor switch protein FliN [Gammaproteobacteria bacterium]
MDETTNTDAPENAGQPGTDTPENTERTGGEQQPETFQAAEFQEVDQSASKGDATIKPNLDLILDVPVTLSLEVGRTEMSVGKLLRLTQGAVVELDRNAGEPLDVMVNGALVAHGEIVVINDKFGIRLVDVVAPPGRELVGQD